MRRKNQSNNSFQLIYDLWLALATLLILSLTTSLLLLLLDPLFNDNPSDSISQPSGLALILSLIGSLLFSYSLLVLLTREYFQQHFKNKLNTSLSWLLFSVVSGFVVALIIHQIIQLYPPQPGEANSFDIIYRDGFFAQVLLMLGTVVIAPFFEEYLFRGMIFDSIRNRFGTFVAIYLSAVVFMGFHLIEYYDYWLGLMAILGLGILLAIIRQRSDSLLNPILCHASYNLSILLLV